MANEAVLIVQTELPVPFTCADGNAIPKGSFLKLADPATVSLAEGTAEVFGGIAAVEKIANDGTTEIGVFRGGRFRVTASGSVTAGGALIMSGIDAAARNYVAAAAADNETTIGFALESATVGQTFLMELRPTAVKQT